MSGEADSRITCGAWMASGPFERAPHLQEALRLELAWNTALRIGRESVPPGPGPAIAENVLVGRADLERIHDYARHFDVDEDPAMVRVAAILRTSEQPPGSSPTAAD